jgi:DNA repair protein RadC
MRVGLTRAVLSQFVDRAVIGEMTVPDRPMDNADDVAALAYEYLRKQPQENLMLVILDGQGRPLQILRHQLGAISSANFAPHVLAGVAASTRGARTVYLVHNHPSTTTRFSSADVMAAQAISKTMEPMGLRFGGSLVVTDGDAQAGTMVPKYIFHPGGELVNHTPAAMSNNAEGDKQTDQRAVHNVVVFDDRPDEGVATTKLQVVERMFEVRKEALFPRIADPKDAVEQIPSLLSNLPGVAMLDKAGRLVGVIQMSISEMRNVSSAGSIIYQEQGQGRDYIGQESDRAPGGQDVRTYRREKFNKDVGPGAWNNPLAMLMAALERSNAESVIISMGPNDVGTSGNDTRTDAVTNLQKAILRVGRSKVEILDVINNKKNFSNLVISQFSNAASYSSGDKTGGRMSTGERTGFNEPGTEYGAEGEGDQAPIEREAPQSLGDVVSQGLEGTQEPTGENAPEGEQAPAPEGQAQEAPAAGAPAEPIIKKTRKPRAKKAIAGDAGIHDFPRTLDTTPGAFGRLSGEQMKKFGLSDAVLDQFIEHSLVTRISSGVDKVKTMDDAAHVVAGMRKRPQEMIVLLITDKTGKPIQIAQHQLGGPASAGFNPGILIGTAASTPGAAQVWFIHNHPSFKASLSPADIGAGNAVENLCKAAGLKYMGTMAVAGSKYAIMDNSGSIISNQQIKPLPRKYTIPVTERMFSYHVALTKKGFDDPSVAAPVLLDTFGPDQPGIVLVDNSNRPVAAIPLAADVLQAMRNKIPGTDQTGFSRFVAGVERAGGVNAFIYTAGTQGAERVNLIENVSRVCNATKITALDAIDNNGVTHSRHIIGYDSQFKESGTGYNRGENAQENAAEGGNEAPGSIREIVEQGLSEPQKKKTRR